MVILIILTVLLLITVIFQMKTINLYRELEDKLNFIEDFLKEEIENEYDELG